MIKIKSAATYTAVALAAAGVSAAATLGMGTATAQAPAAHPTVAGLTTVIVNGTPGARNSSVTCPAGYTITGGGALSNNSVIASYPDSTTSWKTTGVGTRGSLITAYAVCTLL